MLYTMEQLKDKNIPFLSEHSMHNLDVKIVNDFVKKIESSRKGAILPGDSVRLTTGYGEYFPNARVLSVKDNKVIVYEHASAYIGKDDNELGYYLNFSGGVRHEINVDLIKCTDEFCEENFWCFGSLGACAYGGLWFSAKVAVWECKL